jgi:glyoxylase-like metal-dependent hydrolase (beta-lactamase superfamily II)
LGDTLQVNEVLAVNIQATSAAVTKLEWAIPQEIVRGVYRLRMPLPFRLNHINLYLLEDPDGWTLVDCGLNTPETMAAWQNVLDNFLGGKPMQRIVVTHLHPDHIGLAHWLSERTGAPVCMTPLEWQFAQDLFALPLVDPQRLESHYRHLGLVDPYLQNTIRQAGGYRRLVKELPRKVSFLYEHEILDIGGRHWRILLGRGHSPACACLWDESEQLLLVGDHVLPSITPNINLQSIGPGNPLDDFLTSLGTFRNLPCDLALPAHGLPLKGFRERIDELLRHHAVRLDRLQSACTSPLTAAECLPVLFGGEIPEQQYHFAIGEAGAHLVYLAERGSLRQQGELPWRFGQS